MKEWDGSNVLEIVRSFIDEEDVCAEKKHVEFSTERKTFDTLKKSLTEDLERLKNSAVWSRNFPKDAVHGKILSVEIGDEIPAYLPVALNLSMVEMDAINIILRTQIDEAVKKNNLPYDLIHAFININHDFQVAGGMECPTFESFIKD